MRNWLLGIVFSFLLVNASFAQGIGDAALKRGFSVRASGMGGAYTAIADDGSAVFYNPAGLAEPGITYTFGNPDTNQSNINGSFELAKIGYAGYGAWRMSNASSEAVSTTAMAFGNRAGWLNWGLTYKGLNWTVAGVSRSGWTADIGFLARITPSLKVGLLTQDVLTSQAALEPASGRLGFAYKLFDDSVLVAGDMEIGSNSQNFGHFGIEATIVNGLALRGGVDRADITLGATLDMSFFSLDYAVVFSQNGQAAQKFEAGIKFLPRRERPFSIIKPIEYALINVSGSIKGGRTEFSFLGGLRPGLDSILSDIRAATKDKAIDGIMLRLGGFSGGLGGMAVVQEIRDELKRARKNGKKIIAYVEGSAVEDEYYLAAMADKIVAPPGAAVGGLGKSLAIYRLKGLYEKFGVAWQIFKQGKYKDAFDSYTRDKMSLEQEEALEGLVADLYRQMITDVAEDRGMKLDKVKSLGNGMIYSAREAKIMGLVDEIGYYKDAKRLAAEILGEKNEDKSALIVEPKEVVPDEVFLARVFGVAVIEIDGEIVSGSGGENVLFGGRYVGAETITKYIKKASDDVLVKAIILRINSPGGDAIASGEINKALKYAKEKEKLVIASIGSMGTSGGYYIAVAADKIVADRSSLTGSIGVIGYLPYYMELYKKADIKAEIIKEGKHSDMFSGARRMTDEEISAIENIQKESYDEFIQAVVAGRNLATSEVEALAQGRLYTGAQALDLDLIDQLGGFSDAIDLAKVDAKIIGEPRLIFYHEPGFFFPFGEGMAESLGLSLLPLLRQGYN